MKINKKHLLDQIEYIISNGVAECEEVDVTAKKILKLVWPLIKYLQDQNENHEN